MPDDTALVAAATTSVVATALSGLLGEPKTLPAKLFYDEAGCQLFTQITELPEYYLTRTERGLLEIVAPEVIRATAGPVALVEYGASDEAKAEFLMRVRDRDARPVVQAYVPIDVATASLQQMQARLRRSRPDLQVYSLAADFTAAVALPAALPPWRRLGFFPGSTIGNLDPIEAGRFLRQSRKTLGATAQFLVGVDLPKDPELLRAAYDDAAGVTAAFNRNLLVRLNREAEADFDPHLFAHRAVWNDIESRIEMHLVSRCEQSVRIAGHVIRFAAGETIHTENSYKYSPERFAGLVDGSGWKGTKIWKDPQGLFSLHLLEPLRAS